MPDSFLKIAEWTPFVACAVSRNGGNRNGNGDGRGQAAAVRLAEIALLLAFLWFQVDDLKTEFAGLRAQVATLQAITSANAARLDERQPRIP